jgi:hypothetical protein
MPIAVYLRRTARKESSAAASGEGTREASDTLVDLAYAVMREGQTQAMPEAARHRTGGAGQETGPGGASRRLERAGICAVR